MKATLIILSSLRGWHIALLPLYALIAPFVVRHDAREAKRERDEARAEFRRLYPLAATGDRYAANMCRTLSRRIGELRPLDYSHLVPATYAR